MATSTGLWIPWRQASVRVRLAAAALLAVTLAANAAPAAAELAGTTNLRIGVGAYGNAPIVAGVPAYVFVSSWGATDETLVPTGAVAITGTLIVARQSNGGWLSLNPTPINRPTTSNLNFPKGDNRATGVTVPISTSGTESITFGGAPAGSTAEVIFDVSGYFLN